MFAHRSGKLFCWLQSSRVGASQSIISIVIDLWEVMQYPMGSLQYPMETCNILREVMGSQAIASRAAAASPARLNKNKLALSALKKENFSQPQSHSIGGKF